MPFSRKNMLATFCGQFPWFFLHMFQKKTLGTKQQRTLWVKCPSCLSKPSFALQKKKKQENKLKKQGNHEQQTLPQCTNHEESLS